jgi:hypothetical protein
MSKRLPKVVYYRGQDKKWRWKIAAVNSRGLCCPGQGFSSRGEAIRNFDRVRKVMVSGLYNTVFL